MQGKRFSGEINSPLNRNVGFLAGIFSGNPVNDNIEVRRRTNGGFLELSVVYDLRIGGEGFIGNGVCHLFGQMAVGVGFCAVVGNCGYSKGRSIKDFDFSGFDFFFNGVDISFHFFGNIGVVITDQQS